ncbi:MAG: hypothetical protein AAFN13_08405 [Bacteroidota bacterium]
MGRSPADVALPSAQNNRCRACRLDECGWLYAGAPLCERHACIEADTDGVLAERYKQLPGQAAYLAGVFKGLRSWTNPSVRVSAMEHAAVLAGAEELPVSSAPWFDGPLFLLAIGNGWSVGGGFRLTPDARPDDGLLDLCVLRGVTAGRALQLLPRAMRGKHTTAEEVTLDRVTSVTLDSESPLPIHADGEILTTSALRLTTTIKPGALSVLRP